MTAKGGKRPRPGRLALLLPTFCGGGAERVALALIEDWIARGHDIDLLLVEHRGDLLKLLPDEVRVIPLGDGRIRSVIRPLAAYLKRERPIAMQVSMWPLTVAAVIARTLARSDTRLVLSEHISLSREYAHFGAAKAVLMRASLRWAYPKAEARVAVSRDASDDLASLAGLAEDRVKTIYNPVDLRSPAAVPREVEAAWGQGRGKRVLNVGRLSAQKNQSLLLRAFARLPERLDARLVILGQGELEAELRDEAERLGVADRVAFPGFALDPTAYYAAADLFVLSSDYEGFGLVLVEAMAAGLSVVSTDCRSGPREILEDGRYGTLVPCGDADALRAAMEQALDTQADPSRLRARAVELSGRDAPRRYLELMLGEPVAPASGNGSRS